MEAIAALASSTAYRGLKKWVPGLVSLLMELGGSTITDFVHNHLGVAHLQRQILDQQDRLTALETRLIQDLRRANRLALLALSLAGVALLASVSTFFYFLGRV